LRCTQSKGCRKEENYICLVFIKQHNVKGFHNETYLNCQFLVDCCNPAQFSSHDPYMCPNTMGSEKSCNSYDLEID
jgi:hypothetical protein